MLHDSRQHHRSPQVAVYTDRSRKKPRKTVGGLDALNDSTRCGPLCPLKQIPCAEVVRVTIWVKHPLLLAKDSPGLDDFVPARHILSAARGHLGSAGAEFEGCCLNGFEASHLGLQSTVKASINNKQHPIK